MDKIYSCFLQDIAKGVHRVVIVSPEKILDDTRFRSLWTSEKFMSELFAISVDEAHCVTEWRHDFPQNTRC